MSCGDRGVSRLIEELRGRGLAVFVVDTREGCYRARYNVSEEAELVEAMLDFILTIVKRRQAVTQPDTNGDGSRGEG